MNNFACMQARKAWTLPPLSLPLFLLRCKTVGNVFALPASLREPLKHLLSHAIERRPVRCFLRITVEHSKAGSQLNALLPMPKVGDVSKAKFN